MKNAFYIRIKVIAKLRVSSETKGENQIVLEIKRIPEAAKILKERAETDNMSEPMQKKVENAIEESESLEHFGTLRLDALSQKKDQDRLNINQRPKLSYEMFDGSYSGFNTLKKNPAYGRH